MQLWTWYSQSPCYPLGILMEIMVLVAKNVERILGGSKLHQVRFSSNGVYMGGGKFFHKIWQAIFFIIMWSL